MDDAFATAFSLCFKAMFVSWLELDQFGLMACLDVVSGLEQQESKSWKELLTICQARFLVCSPPSATPFHNSVLPMLMTCVMMSYVNYEPRMDGCPWARLWCTRSCHSRMSPEFVPQVIVHWRRSWIRSSMLWRGLGLSTLPLSLSLVASVAVNLVGKKTSEHSCIWFDMASNETLKQY